MFTYMKVLNDSHKPKAKVLILKLSLFWLRVFYIKSNIYFNIAKSRPLNTISKVQEPAAQLL